MSKKARSSKAAIKRYKRPLQQALTCITSSDVWIAGEPSTDEYYRLTVAGGGPVVLDCDGVRMYFDASQRFSVYNDGTEFRVATKGYIYTLSPSERLDSEVVSWHWHPPSHSRPHIHIGDAQLGHVPTGRVTFESVVRYLLEEFGANAARDDWNDTLMTTEALHVKYRSWSVDPGIDPGSE